MAETDGLLRRLVPSDLELLLVVLVAQLQLEDCGVDDDEQEREPRFLLRDASAKAL
jgi:hypothetical protein